MTYGIRVWKYLSDDGQVKQLIDTYNSNNLEFMYDLAKEYKKTYDYWNYVVETINF